jgi:hypothetical protein
MSPEDLATVAESWAQLRLRRDHLADRLAASYIGACSQDAAQRRARWLVDAVAELVDLLTAPSQLAARAREVAEHLPEPGSAPTFLLDGNAWMTAARECSPAWTDFTEHAWRQAWLLLSDVLANESLSPFAR